jgi:hypothetical protein
MFMQFSFSDLIFIFFYFYFFFCLKFVRVCVRVSG